MSNKRLTLKPIVMVTAAAFAMIAGPVAIERNPPDLSWTSVAVAEEDGGGGPGSVNKGGHQGARPEGKGGPKWEAGSSPWPEGKGPPPESDYWNRDGQPPRYGGDPEHSRKPGSATQGGRPQWASQELTDIGRLNVARAPEDVLLRAKDGGLDEVANSLDFYTQVAAILAKYDLTTSEGSRQRATRSRRCSGPIRPGSTRRSATSRSTRICSATASSRAPTGPWCSTRPA